MKKAEESLAEGNGDIFQNVISGNYFTQSDDSEPQYSVRKLGDIAG